MGPSVSSLPPPPTPIATWAPTTRTKIDFLQQLCRCLYTGLASQLHGCSALSQRLGTTPMASSDSLEAEPHQYAKGCRHASTTARATVSENLIGFANGPYSANCTVAQLRLRNGYCLNHAQNRWRYELLHKMTALNIYVVIQGGLNTNCTHLWSLGHPLHTHRQAHVRLSKTPTSGRLDMPKSCGKFDSGYKKHAYNSWGCPDIPTRSGWSPPHEEEYAQCRFCHGQGVGTCLST